MKRIINIISITLGIFIFTACQDELNNELFHKFSYLVENGWQTCEVEIKDGNITELLIDFGINGTSENDKDITLKITNDPDTLADYNFDKFKNQISSYYIELPSNCYSFDQEVYTIPKGKYKTTAKIQIELDKIQNIYNDYVLPLKIESSTGESVGPSKYSKLLAYILPTNRFSGTFSGSGKITIDGTSQSTSVGSAKLYASSINTCYMYAGNTNQDTDPNYKDYAINLSFDEKEHITLTARNVELELEPITNTLTRKYVLHDTDTRYYVQTSVLYLKYKYKDLTEGERRTIVYEGTHTQIKNVLISDYPNVKVEEE